MANVKANLSADDAALVRDCEAEAADARNLALDLAAGGSGETVSLCTLGSAGYDYTPYSDDEQRLSDEGMA